MTTNRDNLNWMSNEELVDLLDWRTCQCCIYDMRTCTKDQDCREGHLQWLDKEIDDTIEREYIIDGIDVTDCEFRNELMCYCRNIGVCDYSMNTCKENKNCYYKLFKRSSEELKNAVSKQCSSVGVELRDENTELKNTLRSIEKIASKKKNV